MSKPKVPWSLLNTQIFSRSKCTELLVIIKVQVRIIEVILGAYLWALGLRNRLLQSIALLQALDGVGIGDPPATYRMNQPIMF